MRKIDLRQRRGGQAELRRVLSVLLREALRDLCASAVKLPLWLITLTVFSPLVLAQSDETTIRITTELVILDAQVLRKKTGVVVSELVQKDFELYEDGVKQEVSFFGKDKLPLSILLLIDTSGSVRPVIEIIRDGAMEALRRLKPEDEVAVMVFGEQAKMIQPFTKDRQLIVQQIGSLLSSTQVGVGTSLHKALHEAAGQMAMASNPLSRRVVITVTDNIASAYRFGDMSEQQVTDRVYDSGSVVCGIVVKSDVPRSLTIFDRTDKDDLFRRRINLAKYVDETGGEIQIVPVIEVNQRLTELIDHLRTRYSVGYSSTNQVLDGKFRRVRLAVTKDALKRHGDLVVRTRQGYYGRERK